MHWHALTTDQASQRLGVEPRQGLSAEAVAQRQAEHGPNELVDRGSKSPWRILWEQFTATMVLILVGAAGVSLAVGDVKDALAILAIVVLFGLLGFVQEYRAEQAMAALRRLSVPTVRVRRGGAVVETAATGLVPGDVVLLEAGNVVPADGRLVECANLRVQEAALTGESEPVEKTAQELPDIELPLGDRRNLVHLGTLATYGRGTMVVTGTGMHTELGTIAQLIQSVAQAATPLQKRLDQLGRGLAMVAVGVAGLVFALGVLRGEPLNLLLLTAISVAVAAVPEGLPAVVTITLALGARRMLQRQALIRKLPAAETLGSVTVICSDKTGTLTENRMTVTVLDVAGHRLDVTENLSHRMPSLDQVAQPVGALSPALTLLLAGGALCNDAGFRADGAPPHFRTLGDPTEGALLVAAARFGLWKQDLETAFPRVGELPFDSERKRMTTVHRPLQDAPGATGVLGSLPGPYVAFVKGSVDGLLAVCTHVWLETGSLELTEHYRSRIQEANDHLARNGMRVLGVAHRQLPSLEALAGDSSLTETGLVFIGLFGMIDPPRPEVRQAVATCRTAGIRPIMITGDHPLTARKIARDLGIGDQGEVMTGQDLDRLSPTELAASVDGTSIYARVSPEHKLRIVRALQERGQVVAMTGDGVNDAPALRQADIGVAMGITGTDVSKEAADMVLLDDNFSTIVIAVAEGRVIYDNIRKFLKFSVAGNIGKVSVVLLAPLAGSPLPLQPLQLLWLNLLTDGLLGLGMGMEPAERSVMQRPPLRSSESIYAGGLLAHILWIGGLTGATALLTGLAYWSAGSPHWQTMVFTVLCFAQVGQALAMRSTRESLFAIGLGSNRSMAILALVVVAAQLGALYLPFMQGFMDTTPLPLRDLGVSVLVSSLVFLALEGGKWRLRKTR